MSRYPCKVQILAPPIESYIREEEMSKERRAVLVILAYVLIVVAVFIYLASVTSFVQFVPRVWPFIW